MQKLYAVYCVSVEPFESTLFWIILILKQLACIMLFVAAMMMTVFTLKVLVIFDTPCIPHQKTNAKFILT